MSIPEGSKTLKSLNMKTVKGCMRQQPPLAHQPLLSNPSPWVKNSIETETMQQDWTTGRYWVAHLHLQAYITFPCLTSSKPNIISNPTDRLLRSRHKFKPWIRITHVLGTLSEEEHSEWAQGWKNFGLISFQNGLLAGQILNLLICIWQESNIEFHRAQEVQQVCQPYSVGSVTSSTNLQIHSLGHLDE